MIDGVWRAVGGFFSETELDLYPNSTHKLFSFNFHLRSSNNSMSTDLRNGSTKV
jgi:hypothetical protein